MVEREQEVAGADVCCRRSASGTLQMDSCWLSSHCRACLQVCCAHQKDAKNIATPKNISAGGNFDWFVSFFQTCARFTRYCVFCCVVLSLKYLWLKFKCTQRVVWMWLNPCFPFGKSTALWAVEQCFVIIFKAAVHEWMYLFVFFLLNVLTIRIGCFRLRALPANRDPEELSHQCCYAYVFSSSSKLWNRL